MLKKSCLGGVAGLACGLSFGVAMAAPRESTTFTNVVSEGDLISGLNQTRSHVFTGGYQVGWVRVDCSLTPISPDTWSTDSRVLVTPPSGGPFVVQPFDGGVMFGTEVAENFRIRMGTPIAASAGSWSFQFYEDFVDAEGGADAQWDSITFQLDDDVTPAPGSLPETARVPEGTGTLTTLSETLFADGTAQMFRIRICEPANFSASTIGGTDVDTQLYLFTEEGLGVAYSDEADDFGQSIITNQFTATLTPGDYFVAVSEWDTAALDAFGQRLWMDEPWDVERAPDGPGAANMVAGWETDFGEGGSYTITLTGACFAGPSFDCAADLDNGSGTGTRDDAVTIDDLLYFLVQFEAGNVAADLDNGTSTGTRDDAVTIDDLLYFLIRFEAGC